jgi:hypothetical protein
MLLFCQHLKWGDYGIFFGKKKPPAVGDDLQSSVATVTVYLLRQGKIILPRIQYSGRFCRSVKKEGAGSLSPKERQEPCGQEELQLEFGKYINIILSGFVVWLLIAPRLGRPQYGELFLAYMAALLLSLIASSEIMMVKPVAFFFTIGGVLAFCYVVARSLVVIRIKK